MPESPQGFVNIGPGGRAGEGHGSNALASDLDTWRPSPKGVSQAPGEREACVRVGCRGLRMHGRCAPVATMDARRLHNDGGPPCLANWDI